MKSEYGSMLMEAVMALPLLIALALGAIQMAHIHTARQVVSYAAFAAARATLPVEQGKEQEAAEKAARRILCWLVAAPDAAHDGVLMPDPESKPVKDRLLQLKIKGNSWTREVELAFAFPLVVPMADRIIGYAFNPADFSSGQPGGHISTQQYGDAFEGPHLIFHERMSILKPCHVKAGHD